MMNLWGLMDGMQISVLALAAAAVVIARSIAAIMMTKMAKGTAKAMASVMLPWTPALVFHGVIKMLMKTMMTTMPLAVVPLAPCAGRDVHLSV